MEKPARSPRGLAEHAVTCRASGSPPRDEEIRAADQMAPRDNAGLIGKAKPRTSSVADSESNASRPAAGTRLVVFTRERTVAARLAPTLRIHRPRTQAR